MIRVEKPIQPSAEESILETMRQQNASVGRGHTTGVLGGTTHKCGGAVR